LFAIILLPPIIKALTTASLEDPRKREEPNEMLETLEMEKRGTPNDSFYYEARTSFLLRGVDEWQWTTYCCVDTFFGNEENPQWYTSGNMDGPPGGGLGGQPASYPIWNPREYLLLVLARRTIKATKEWTNVISKLEPRLDEYVLVLEIACDPSMILI
jgi:hypothetical protein